MTQRIPPTELAGDTVEQSIPPLPSKRRLALSTAFFSLATALSRIAGLAREVVAAGYFGVRGPMSAFTIAFQVPNLLRSLVADAALQAAFVPVFTELLEKGRRREAFQLASTLFFVILLALGALTAILILLAPLLMPLFAPGFGPDLKSLTVSLAQLLFPIVLLLGLSGVIVGILNSFEHFSVPAIAPLFWNVVIIATLVALTGQFEGQDRIYAYAVGVLAGTAVQVVLPLPWLRRYHFRFLRAFDWRDPRVRTVAKLMLPVTVGLGLINFNLSVDSIFATLISSQAPAAIDKAFRVYMLPQGIFSVAVATVLFPTLSRLVARNDRSSMALTLAAGTRQVLLLLIPAGAAMLVLSDQIIRVIYQRGEFDAAQTALVADALKFFALSLPFAGLNLLLTRAFFSLRRPWVPTVIALANLGVNATLDALLYGPLGVGGIALSTAIVSAVTTLALAYVLHGDLGRMDIKATIDAATRIVLAAAIFGVVSYIVWSALNGLLADGFIGALVGLCGGLAAGSVVYVALVLLLKVQEARQIARALIGRKGLSQ